jgi:hypothetical protein
MPLTLHSISKRATQKVALCASSILYVAFGVPDDDERCVPPLAPFTSHIPDIDQFAISATTDGEEEAQNLRQSQQKSWTIECEERIVALNMLYECSTSGQIKFITKAGQNVVASSTVCDPQALQRAHLPEFIESRNTRHTMYEQQTGIIRTQQPDATELYSSESSLRCHGTIKRRTLPIAIIQDHISIDHDQGRLDKGRVSNDSFSGSSLRRRGALKRKANPLFARPVAQDFEHANCAVDDFMEWKYLVLDIDCC